MPLYDIRCMESGKSFERHIPLADFEKPIECACGAPAIRLISRVSLALSTVDYGYTCPVTGKEIIGKAAHEDNLKRHGCHVLETGEKEAAVRRREEADARLDREIEQTVEKAIDAMPSDKREVLGRELSSGVDAAVVRG